MSVLDTILDKADEQEIRRLNVIVDKIESLEKDIENMSDDELKMTDLFRDRLKRRNFR